MNAASYLKSTVSDELEIGIEWDAIERKVMREALRHHCLTRIVRIVQIFAGDRIPLSVAYVHKE